MGYEGEKTGNKMSELLLYMRNIAVNVIPSEESLRDKCHLMHVTLQDMFRLNALWLFCSAGMPTGLNVTNSVVYNVQDLFDIIF